MNHYYTVEKTGQAEYRDRGSRFIAFVFPVNDTEDFKKKWKEIKNQHPKAVHHCYAYRIGPDGHQYRSNDDREPSGTAGKPILGQIDSKQLTDVGVVVVRYFGGTLLGVSGLIEAYKTSASLALQMVPSIKKPIMDEFYIECTSNEIHAVYQLVKHLGGKVGHTEQLLFTQSFVHIPRSSVNNFIEKMSEMYQVICRKNN